MGDGDSTPVNIVVSTLMEAESVLPLLQEYQQRGRRVNVRLLLMSEERMLFSIPAGQNFKIYDLIFYVSRFR